MSLEIAEKIKILHKDIGLLKNNIDWDFNQDFEYEVDISKGKNVYHQKFGNGKIIKLDGDKALIDFDNFSSKKVYLKFLKIID